MSSSRLALLGLLCCLGCSKTEPPRRTEPWLAHPSASASASVPDAPLGFHFTRDSRIHFTLSGKKGKVTGQVPLSEGTLRLDPRDLKHSQATLDADLTQLRIDEAAMPEGVELSGQTPSALAQQWLELGPGVAPERKNQLGRARFALSSVESVSSSFLDFGARAKGHVRATIVGTLLIHGFRAPVRTDVLLAAVEVPAGAPRRLSIRSVGGLVVALAPHDIMARDASGVADTLAMARSADWLGKSVRIEVELLAEQDAAGAK